MSEETEQRQAAWDKLCQSKGLRRRGGQETRYDERGCYYLVPGYGRVMNHPELGWIVVVSVVGFEDQVYQYVRLGPQ